MSDNLVKIELSTIQEEEKVVEEKVERKEEEKVEEEVEEKVERKEEEKEEEKVERKEEEKVEDENDPTGFHTNISKIIFFTLQHLKMQDMLIQSNVNISPELISILNYIVCDDTLVSETEKTIMEIIKDGKINSNDIPQLILLVQKIYQFIYSLKHMKIDTKKRCELTGNVLKYIIHLLILKGVLVVKDHSEMEVIQHCDTLIDSCIGLMTFPKMIKPKKCLLFSR